MTVLPLPIRNRRGGTTAQDARQASRFVFARPGWRLAERAGVENEACLDISVDRPQGGPPLSWRVTRAGSGILVEHGESARKVGPYAGLTDALLGIWEDAERRLAQLQSKPTILLFGLDPISALAIQDLALIAGFEPHAAPDAGIEPILRSGLDLAAAVVDLQLPAFGGDGRAVIRRLRQHRPRLPILALTIHAPHAPEADLHGLGGPTQRERRPFDPDRVLHWLRGAFEAHAGDEGAPDASGDRRQP